MSAATLMTSPLAALTQQQIDWCVNASHQFSLDQQISGCTAAIESGGWSGKNLAWAFNNRGYPYLLKGDLDHAIADFEQANHACSLGRSGHRVAGTAVTVGLATSVYKCWRNSFNTDSHKRSGSSSPVFASSIIFFGDTFID